MTNAQKLQNFAARVAFGGVRKHEHISPVFWELQWLRIRQQYLLDVGVIVFKLLMGFYADCFLSFKSRRAITNDTRQMQQLHVARTSTPPGTGAWPSTDQHSGIPSRSPLYRHLHSPLLRQNLRNLFYQEICN